MRELFGRPIKEGDLVIIKPSMGDTGMQLGEVTKRGTVMLGYKTARYNECFLIEDPTPKMIEEAEKNRRVFQEHKDYLKEKREKIQKNRLKKEDVKLFKFYEWKGVYLGDIIFQEERYANAFCNVSRHIYRSETKVDIVCLHSKKEGILQFINTFKSFPLVEKERPNYLTKKAVFEAISNMLNDNFKNQKNCLTFLDTGEWVTGTSYKMKKDD